MHTQDAVALNALTVSLRGNKLIEASAGTGKTHTITTLYIRLLIGHGNDSAHPLPLSVEQILVVTFTEAATEELRDRIRRRIRETRIAFMRGTTKDDTIHKILMETSDHNAAANILLQAERQMDEASIYTIHGFCQRMLTQNAFEAGTLFNSEFMPDEGQVRAEVIADFWRKYFYKLPKSLAAEISSHWSTPSDLLRDINPFISGNPVDITSSSNTDGDILEIHKSNLAKIDAMKKEILTHSQQDLHDLIASSGVNKRSYTKASLPKGLAALFHWAQSRTSNYEMPDALGKFSSDTLMDKTPKGDPPEHPLFDKISEFINNKPDIEQAILKTAIETCRVSLQESKLTKSWMSFDDLLTNLAAALATDDTGILAQRIRIQHPFAMIDEFQDTDPLQYSIFDTIYESFTKPSESECINVETGLFMIGDPKQAIYAFRGADIFTYIKARRTVAEKLTLGTNWRSSHEIVEGINQIFKCSDKPFIYDDDIKFLPAKAKSEAGERVWDLDGINQPAITIWHQTSEETVSKGDYQKIMAGSVAYKIQEILTLAQDGKASTANRDKRKTVQAGNIAVLVRTGFEAEIIRKALAKQGISSVYLSSRESVYGTVQAKDIQRLLNAVLDAKNEHTLRGALASGIFNVTPTEIEELNLSENSWDKVIVEFIDYLAVWRRSGILPMLRKVITSRGVAANLMKRVGGERELTNILHVGELLQQASQTIDSEHGLIKFLDENIKEPNGNTEDQQLRLESERDLVQIVTIHKSKGLEYDFVFMPFICAYRDVTKTLYHNDSTGRATLDLTGDDKTKAIAEKERLAEDLRLLYVGVTRAVYGLFLGVAPIRNGLSRKSPTGIHKTAIGWLLQNGDLGGVGDLAFSLEQLSNPPYIHIAAPDTPLDVLWTDVKKEANLVKASYFKGNVESDWWVTSYSNLVSQGSHGHGAAYDSASVDPSLFKSKEQRATSMSDDVNIFTFPRGAVAGTFLHEIFEEVEYTESALSDSNTGKIASLMKSNGFDEKWLPVLQKLVDDITNYDLDGKGMKLNLMPTEDRLVEMEFLLPISKLNAPKLNSLLDEFDPLSKGLEVNFRDVSGLLKGFIDLIFVSNGKYYVLDWKSNYLGDDSNDYHDSALKTAMAEHRYDLQYNLYIVALDRFLRTKIKDYSYEKHMGGAYYIFLRGIKDGQDTGVYFSKPPEKLIEGIVKLMDD